jgi:hypothetical protein
MTGEDLIAEGQKLAKPCVYLVTSAPSDAPIAAIWGEEPILGTPGDDFRHWLSIDCSVLLDNTSNGVMGVYSNEDDCETGTVLFSATTHLTEHNTDGVLLYAQPGLSLPPIEAVFKFGSSAVKEWLEANDWLPGDGDDAADYAYNNNFPDRAIAEIYLEEWQNQLPLYSGGAYAVLGGWHFPWPDGDWDKLLNQTLVVWTFEESEPWIEVWRDSDNNYSILQRIT